MKAALEIQSEIEISQFTDKHKQMQPKTIKYFKMWMCFAATVNQKACLFVFMRGNENEEQKQTVRKHPKITIKNTKGLLWSLQ